MAMDAHVDWAQRLISYRDQGDFSTIGRPCVFTINAWAQLRTAWGMRHGASGKRRLEPFRALIGQHYLTAAWCPKSFVAETAIAGPSVSRAIVPTAARHRSSALCLCDIQNHRLFCHVCISK
jgi:hypothetical protein